MPILGPFNSLGILQATGFNGDIIMAPLNFNTNSGTFTGTIPPGATGPAGPQGPTGVQGVTGPMGATGTAASATPNLVSFDIPTGTGSTTVSCTTANLTKAKSGMVLVVGSCAATANPLDAITGTLVRDLVTTPLVFATQKVTAISSVGAFNVSFSWIDTLPDGNPHTYSIRLVDASNNITVASGSTLILAIEQ
jgi:hypothetical protein